MEYEIEKEGGTYFDYYSIKILKQPGRDRHEKWTGMQTSRSITIE